MTAAESKRTEAYAPLASALVHVFFAPYLIMLALGALHDISPAVPAIGYWTTVLIVMGARQVMNVVRGTSRKKSEA